MQCKVGTYGSFEDVRSIKVSYMEVKMQNILTKALNYLGAALMTTLPASAVNAKRKIIQQEQISFEKCLKVITVSQDKLSIA